MKQYENQILMTYAKQLPKDKQVAFVEKYKTLSPENKELVLHDLATQLPEFSSLLQGQDESIEFAPNIDAMESVQSPQNPQMAKYGKMKEYQKGGNIWTEYKGVDGRKNLQRKLKDLGYYTGEIDGKIGKLSIAAIRKFQEDNKVENSIRKNNTGDGIAGVHTLRALNKVYDTSKRSQTSSALPDEVTGENFNKPIKPVQPIDINALTSQSQGIGSYNVGNEIRTPLPNGGQEVYNEDGSFKGMLKGNQFIPSTLNTQQVSLPLLDFANYLPKDVDPRMQDFTNNPTAINYNSINPNLLPNIQMDNSYLEQDPRMSGGELDIRNRENLEKAKKLIKQGKARDILDAYLKLGMIKPQFKTGGLVKPNIYDHIKRAYEK